MATVRIDLPDQLAQDAERAGLLSSAALESLIREQLRARAANKLLEAIHAMDQADDTPYMSPEEVAEEMPLCVRRDGQLNSLDPMRVGHERGRLRSSLERPAK